AISIEALSFRTILMITRLLATSSSTTIALILLISFYCQVYWYRYNYFRAAGSHLLIKQIFIHYRSRVTLVKIVEIYHPLFCDLRAVRSIFTVADPCLVPVAASTIVHDGNF